MGGVFLCIVAVVRQADKRQSAQERRDNRQWVVLLHMAPVSSLTLASQGICTMGWPTLTNTSQLNLQNTS